MQATAAKEITQAKRAWRNPQGEVRFAQATATPGQFLGFTQAPAPSTQAQQARPRISVSLPASPPEDPALSWEWNPHIHRGSLREGAPEGLASLARALPVEEIISMNEREELFWVRGANAVWMPVSLAPELWREAAAAQEQGEAPSSLSRASLAALALAGIARPADLPPEPAADFFRGTGHLHLEGVLSPWQRILLARQAAMLRREGLFRLGDRDSPLRAWAHNELLCRWVHLQIAPHINQRLGTALRPYFTNLVAYLGGSELPVHKDKHPDAFSLSVAVDYERDSLPDEDRWSFFVEQAHDTGKFHEHRIGLGNGVLFHGALLDHYRGKLPANEVATVLLLNFVQPDSRLLYR